jgi:hypothetical protein
VLRVPEQPLAKRPAAKRLPSRRAKKADSGAGSSSSDDDDAGSEGGPHREEDGEEEEEDEEEVAVAPSLPATVGVAQALLLADAADAFSVFDADGSGTIDHAEFGELIGVLGVRLPGGEHAIAEVGARAHCFNLGTTHWPVFIF